MSEAEAAAAALAEQEATATAQAEADEALDKAGILKDLKGERTRSQTERTRAEAAEKALKDIQDAQTEAERKAAEKAGEFETLYSTSQTELGTTKEKLAGLQTRETARLETVTTDADAIVAKWDEEDRAMDPKNLDADERLRMVRLLDKRFTGTETMPHGTRSRGSTDKGPIPQWVKDNFKEFQGRDPKDDDELRKWEGYLRAEPRYADKFKTT